MSRSGPIRGWSKRLSLRQRILAVNIFALAILFGGIFYLDSFRSRLTQARVDQAQSEAVMIAHMLAAVPADRREPILVRLGRDSGTRLRLYAPDGARVADSWNDAPPTYTLRDPAESPGIATSPCGSTMASTRSSARRRRPNTCRRRQRRAGGLAGGGADAAERVAGADAAPRRRTAPLISPRRSASRARTARCCC